MFFCSCRQNDWCHRNRTTLIECIHYVHLHENKICEDFLFLPATDITGWGLANLIVLNFKITEYRLPGHGYDWTAAMSGNLSGA